MSSKTTTSAASSIWSFLGQREVIATLTVVPAVYFYWKDLVESLEGNVFVACLIVVGAWFGIAIDLNEHMTGQPESDHDHHD